MTAHDRSISPAPPAADSITVEVRLLTSLSKFSEGRQSSEKIDVPAETTVGDLIRRYRLPLNEIARVLCNGRDMNPGTYTGGNLDLGASISDGDVITFAGAALDVPGVRSSAV